MFIRLAVLSSDPVTKYKSPTENVTLYTLPIKYNRI